MGLWTILFLAGLGMIGLEVVLPTLFWMPLGLGALATAPLSYFLDHWSILGLWPLFSLCAFYLIKMIFNPGKNSYKSGVEALTGKKGLVMEAIERQSGTGTVKVQGDLWHVFNVEEDIPVGAKVKVVSVEGNRLCVEEIIDVD